MQIYGYLFPLLYPLKSISSWDIKRIKHLDDYEEEWAGEPIYPAILQTNRTIYAEAAPELYGKTIFAIDFSDIVYISDRETSHDMEKGRARVWRPHYPCGTGYLNDKIPQIHASDKVRGNVEPHIFAKFESLNCYINLDFDNEDLEPHLRVDKDHGFVDEDEAQFSAALRQSDVIRNFVSLLSNSPFINHLYMMVAIPVIPEYTRSLTWEEDSLLKKQNLERKYAADSRAWELFLDNNMLAPLETLSNVRRFELHPILPHHQPQQHYVKMIQDLKERIERNWQLSQAARNSNRA